MKLSSLIAVLAAVGLVALTSPVFAADQKAAPAATAAAKPATAAAAAKPAANAPLWTAADVQKLCNIRWANKPNANLRLAQCNKNHMRSVGKPETAKDIKELSGTPAPAAAAKPKKK